MYKCEKYIFLQEVETDQFFNFFLPELKRDGYDGIFSPKSRARTMTEVDRKHVDGCAIFFRTSKYAKILCHICNNSFKIITLFRVHGKSWKSHGNSKNSECHGNLFARKKSPRKVMEISCPNLPNHVSIVL